MLYKQRSFSVPATGKTVISCKDGHAMADSRGHCIRCGDTVADKEIEAPAVSQEPV